jgi:hypothetical protein
LHIPAGLSALPRQTQAFPEVRIALQAEVARHLALHGWQARGERDFGLMWLEMWAYVADVLGFYDERIANESYIRTAVQRSSLRRIVDLLGYVPAPGVAGTATIAAIAEGRTPVSVPASTGFRSDAFSNQSPQVFESTVDGSIHPLTNSWQLGPVEASLLTGIDSSSELVFQTANFGLAKNRIVVFSWNQGTADAPSIQRQAQRVTAVTPFQGKDNKTYLRVSITGSLTIPAGLAPTDVEVRTPTVTAAITTNSDTPIDQNGARVLLDAIYRQLKVNDIVVVSDTSSDALITTTATRVEETAVEVTDIVPKPGAGPKVPITRLTMEDPLPSDASAAALAFQFVLVDAGRLTLVAETEPTVDALKNPPNPDGVLVTGIVERPPTANAAGVLEQLFLLRDADTQGALVTGRMTFNADGTARFLVTGNETIPDTFKTPITVFGNVIQTSRGESVFDEVLGNGDPRQLHQAFKLKKKPLTYLFDPTVEGTQARSTLAVTVDGIAWHEVKSFFNATPTDRVYIVRPDDQGNAFVIFGDGVRGARPPSGVKNVRASYRFGSGEAAPPAGAIKQLAKAVKGLRRVESPIAAVSGKDPVPPESLRTSAPRTALLADRAVSTLDFEVLANLLPGVVKATAEFAWIPDQQDAGVVVTYIGTVDRTVVLTAMRDQAEPNLPLDAVQATAIRMEFWGEVEVDPDFDPDVVKEAVKAKLIDTQTGVLSQRQAPIGGRVFRSVVLDAMQTVPGVVSVTSAVVHQANTIGAGDFKDTNIIGTCAGPGVFLDFAPDDVHITGKKATAPVLATGATP